MQHEDSKTRRNRLDKINIIRDAKTGYMVSDRQNEKARERFFRPAYGKKAGGES